MAARFTFIASANQATNGVSLGAAGQDVIVYKILIGTPVGAGVIRVYNKATAFNADTADIAHRNTQPTFGAGNNSVREIDFGPDGLRLDGGNVQTSANEDVTVIWDVTG